MNISENQAAEIVDDLATQVIKRVKQELSGETEEFLPRVLRQFKSELARYTWKHSQKWSKWTDDGPVLMPDFTRIYYRKGKTEIALQEFPPQIRLLRFKGALVNRSNTSEDLPTERMQSTHHFSVALPYVVFLFRYVDGLFQDVKCTFCDRPLRTLDEKPLRPYLCNINAPNLDVCLGTSFDRNKLVKNNITQQAAYVLDHFWNTTYSDEWSSHYWANRAHFQRTDPRLASLEQWQTASEENPLFVVDDVNWLPNQDESFGDMIVNLVSRDAEDHKLHEELHQHLSENFFEQVTKTYSTNVDSISERITEKMKLDLAAHLQERLKDIS